MKTADIHPYHLFEHRWTKFAFDIGTNSFIRIDDIAYEVLEKAKTGLTENAIIAELAGKYHTNGITNTLRELRLLRQKGYFRRTIRTWDDADNAGYVEKLVNMPTNRIELYLAGACNLRCKYCYAGQNKALNNDLMPQAVAKQAVDFVFEKGKNSDEISITLFGGEPLLNKPVLSFVIEYSQKLGAKRGKRVRYVMTTNATLMDPQIINYIKRYNFGLMISLDGPKNVHDNMRPFASGEGSFDRTTEKVKLLMQRRRRVTVRSTLTKACLDKVRIVKFLEDFGFTRIVVGACNGKSCCLGQYDIGPEESAILDEQDKILLERFLEQVANGETIKYNPWASGIKDLYDRKSIFGLRCGVGRGCTTVGIDGKLYPCHRYVGMKNYVIGDVWSGLDQEKYVAYLHAYLSSKEKCKSCWAMNICGGSCPWYVSHENGSCVPPKEWWCDRLKHGFEETAWLYEKLRTEYPDYFAKLVKDDHREKLATGTPDVPAKAGLEEEKSNHDIETDIR